jgi:phage shock protein C
MRSEATMRRCGDWWRQSSCGQRWQEPWKRAWEQHGELRRETDGARIAGVCAGIGRHFGVDPFLVRIAWIGSFFVLGPFTIFAYLLAVALLPKRPREVSTDPLRAASGEAYDRFRKDKRHKRREEWVAEPETRRAPEEDPGTVLDATRERLRATEKRIAALEAYIAAREFDLSRKINDLET